MLEKLDFLSGYKTYVVAILTTAYGVVAHHGSVSTLAPYVLSGLGLAALRAAVAKVEAVIATIESKLPPSVERLVEPTVAAVESVVNQDVNPPVVPTVPPVVTDTPPTL